MPSSPMNGVLMPYTLPSDIVYFHDWRYVDHAYLRWVDDKDTPVPLMPAPSPLPPIHADPQYLPRGIRIEAVPAVVDDAPILSATDMGEIMFVGGPVIKEQGVYRLFYECFHPHALSPERITNYGETKYVRYAESNDGRHWRFSKVGSIEVAGSRDNNVVFDPAPIGYFQGGSVFIDPSSTDERYKLIFMGMVDKATLDRYLQRWPKDVDPSVVFDKVARGFAGWAVFGAVSPDGFSWKLLEDPLLIQHSDTANVGVYDAVRKKYVFYTRSWFYQRRSVARSESDDFRHFPAPEQLLWPDATTAPDQTWYKPGYAQMPGAPDYHLMFPVLWKQTDDTFTPHLMSSPDGLVWSRCPGLVGGPGKLGSWTQCGFNMGSLVDLPGDRFGSLALGWNLPHKHPRPLPGFGQAGWVTWQRGRLTALKSDTDGRFGLFPLKFNGRKAILNFRTLIAGQIQVAVYGKSLYRTFEDCDLITGDELDRVVTWKGESDLKHADGEAVQLLFRMQNAELFSVRFE